MDIWSKEIEEKATAADLLELLYLARALWHDTYPLKDMKVLQKSNNKLRQQRKPYRLSGISDAIRSRVLVLSFNMISCQKIADIIYNEFGKSISRSTVNRIINGKYKPKFIK